MPSLDPKTVHVWTVSLDVSEETVGAMASLLSPDERQRAAQFRFAEHRRRYIVARGNLRSVLARYLNLLPQEVVFDYSPRGKPQLATVIAHCNLQFNVSHSHDLAAFALALGWRVGIDIEWVDRQFDWAELAARYLTTAERASLERLPEALRGAGFLRWWTRQEAYAKAADCALDAILRNPRGAAGNDVSSSAGMAPWQLSELPMPGNYVGTLACEGSAPAVEYF